MKEKLKFLFKLFLIFFKISAFTIGGGYVIVPLIQKEFSEKRKLIEPEEMMDIIALAQASPGAVAINTSALVGKRLAGYKGVLAALFGAVLPPFLCLVIVSFFYTLFISNEIVANVLLGMRAGVTAVIIDAVITMALPVFKKKASLWFKILSFTVLPLSFVSVFFFKINPIFIIVFSVLLGIIMLKIEEGGKKK